MSGRWRHIAFAPLQGSVTFRAEGGFSERFLNLCNVRGIALMQPQMHEKKLIATVRRRDYRRLRTIARRSGMTLRVIDKQGLPFFLRRHRARLALPAAAAFFALLAAMLSGFIWSVQTDGCSQVSREEVLSVLEDCGLKPGVWRRALNTEEIAARAMRKLNGRVSWLGVNFSGSRAVIEVHDYTDPGKDDTFGPPANIVADFDGLLLSLQVYSGKAAAFVGSGVCKGDLLISGVTTDRYGEAHFYEARGVATALHSDVFTCRQPIGERFACYKAIHKVPALRLLHLTIPLGMFPLFGDYDVFFAEQQAELGGVPLPLSIITQTRCYRDVPRRANTFPLLLDDSARMAEERYAATNVLSSKLRLTLKGDEYSLKTKSRCIDFIGTSRRIRFSGGATS